LLPFVHIAPGVRPCDVGAAVTRQPPTTIAATPRHSGQRSARLAGCGRTVSLSPPD
jgi:hypothetical protein